MDCLKKHNCKVCKVKYVKTKPLQSVCGFECSLVLSKTKTKKEKSIKLIINDDKKTTKQKLDALKTKPELVKELQAVFNAYIRQRDYGNNCISCQKPILWGLGSTGGVCDAGHYLSIGSRPNLRFNEDNVNAQCKHCNNFLAGNVLEYRKGLISKIGLQKVEALECDQSVNKYSREDLKNMISKYKLKIKNKL
jgi:hypothetical protein